MLDDKSLAALQSLKSDIKASKTIYEGTIKGTGRKFGFVVNSEDASEHFLPPDEMSRVFPGDQVRYTVLEQDDGKTRAELEELIQSDFTEFNGVFHVRGKAQGVEPFDSAFSGWLFIPPRQTGDANANDIVKAKVTRHPWDTGKAQAEVSVTLGSADNNRSWYSMALAEHAIPEQFTDEESHEAEVLANPESLSLENYLDLTALPFVTIDSASTQDMDDALYAEPKGDGWILHVAIADASAFIQPDSLLETAARKRLTATYLPGLTLPMLPPSLANDAMSLLQDEVRPALVFRLTVAADGSVSQVDIVKAHVRNQAKLSYDQVADWLVHDNIPAAQAEHLKALKAATDALANWRSAHANQMNDRVDYRIRVDDEFNVTAIDQEPKNPARALVEEAMVATNYQAACWLQERPGLFMAHGGFKPDRETELKGLLRDYAPTVANCNGHELQDFRTIISTAQQQTEFPLLSVLQKRFDRGYWSTVAEPHFGLGLSRYTNVTSPIRKYSDLCMHRLIKSLLDETEQPDLSEVAQMLNERGNVSRFAAQKVENRLRNQWLAQQPKQTYTGRIVHLKANGLIVQLDDSGAVGQVDLRKLKDDFSYDPLRMRIKFENFEYRLDQTLSVDIAQVTPEQLQLSIVSEE